jgi:DNA-binding transcriptional ArsR family regulator
MSWLLPDDEPDVDDVAEKLGVDRSLVSRVISNVNAHIIYHDRVKARRYYEENPDASYREVSRNVDSSQPTVTEWLKEDFDEGDAEDDDPARCRCDLCGSQYPLGDFADLVEHVAAHDEQGAAEIDPFEREAPVWGVDVEAEEVEA